MSNFLIETRHHSLLLNDVIHLSIHSFIGLDDLSSFFYIAITHEMLFLNL